MGGFIGNLFEVSLGLGMDDDTPSSPSIYRGLLAQGHYLHGIHGKQFTESLKCALSVMMGEVFRVEGKPVNLFSAQLNTALNIGGDEVKLMARLHGQCEIHCYVEGANRDWLAGIIERGIKIGLFREAEDWETGWSNVITLLRSRNDCPVVTSFSVCEQFPNPGVADWEAPVVDGEKNWDAWYDLPSEKQWELSLQGLRAQPSLEMKPDNWKDYYFRDAVDGFGLAEYARKAAKPNLT
jgi:hypothetical protein